MWRVTWAHPEFGQVLASCSFDRTAAVWEEIVGESNDKLRGQSHWVRLFFDSYKVSDFGYVLFICGNIPTLSIFKTFEENS